MNNNGSVSCYFYDAAGERTVKLTSESEMVHVNGKKVGGNDNICKFTAYVSPYFVVSNGGAYTKHIYAASQRIASKLGNEDGFGADPRRVEMAGGKKISDFQKGNVGERFKALGYEYSAPEKEKVEKDSTMDSEAEEKLIFFYHPDHLGSTSYVTDADGNIAQHIEYIPYGEVFVEERNSQFSTNFLFNAKELDNETGLYYYGARYLDPTGAMWLSVDPMWEKFAGMSPYNYCMGNPIVYIDPDGSFSVGQTDGEGIYICDYSLSLTPEEIDLYKNLVNNFENIIKSEDGKGYDETLLTLISDICGLSRDQIINDMKPGQGPTVLFRDGATEGSANGIWVNSQIVKKLYAAVNSNETINRGGTIVTKYEETLFLSAMEFLHEYIHNGDERTNGQITGQWTMKGGSKVMEQDSNGNDQPLGKQKDGMSRTGHRGNDITTYGFGCNVTEKLTKKGGYFIDYVGAGFNGGKIGKTIKSVTNKLNNVWRQKK